MDEQLTTMPQVDVIGVGSPLVDLVLEVDDVFLQQHVSGAKGGMEYVEAEAIARMIAAAAQPPVIVPGGAAANVVAGIGALGVPSGFVGNCGNDDYAQVFRHGLQHRGCQPRLFTSDLPTGQVLSLVTPDAQRTMRTCLGAAVALDPQLMTPQLFQGARLVIVEGYTLFNQELTEAVVRAAGDAGCRLALDLASFEVVNANRALLDDLLRNHIDIVFANEDEARAWTGDDDELAALRALSECCSVVVVKVGADGAWLRVDGDEQHIPAQGVEAVVDTTGAGDTWAAGFLAGYLRGAPWSECGVLGAQAAAAVVQVHGAMVPMEAWQPIRGRLDAWI
ncbi:MAG: adenosine kinase [Planctomycetota bacterium]|nr:MAG: adenosine kinase [Planctomycetota bacterium]